MRPEWKQGQYKECTTKRRECQSISALLIKLPEPKTETDKYKSMYETAEFGVAGDPQQAVVPPPAMVEKQIAREHVKKAKFLVETAASCAIGKPQSLLKVSRSERVNSRVSPSRTLRKKTPAGRRNSARGQSGSLFKDLRIDGKNHRRYDGESKVGW